MKSIILIPLVIFGLILVNKPESTPVPISERTVSSVLAELGENNRDKQPDFTMQGVSAEKGRELVIDGFTTSNGKKTKKQSKHFKCISCHNVVKEDIDLADPNPQSRLEYTNDLGVPFLQGTTLYGAVNRSTYYNGDYDKKYGDLVKPARNDIRGAIQLCAVECAQGRELKDWEIESILAYLWFLELKMTDLIFTPDELREVVATAASTEERAKKADLIKSKFASKADAHFEYPPDDRKKGYVGVVGNADNGKLIYENSCLYCHENRKYSFLHLDNSKLSFKSLHRKAGSYHGHSIYQVTRWGVPSKSGKSSYMPQYPIEKMSNQQLEDLRAYIAFKAE